MWILVSHSPLRIYGIDGRREWIVVRSKQGDREVQLSLTKRFFLDKVRAAQRGESLKGPVHPGDRA
jgi:hypothetical protein